MLTVIMVPTVIMMPAMRTAQMRMGMEEMRAGMVAILAAILVAMVEAVAMAAAVVEVGVVAAAAAGVRIPLVYAVSVCIGDGCAPQPCFGFTSWRRGCRNCSRSSSIRKSSM